MCDMQNPEVKVGVHILYRIIDFTIKSIMIFFQVRARIQFKVLTLYVTVSTRKYKRKNIKKI